MTLANNYHHLEITYYLDSDVPRQVIGDYIHIRQIFVNLICNILKKTVKGFNFRVSKWKESNTDQLECKPKSGDQEFGTSIVHIKSSGLNLSENLLIFSLQNTGSGLSETIQSNIFESISESGLGLTICKHLIELMDGALIIKSNQHVITIFVLLPLIPITLEPSRILSPGKQG